MLRRTFLRTCLVTQKQLRDVVARLDSFEKEVVSLKAFRAAVEIVSPEVASAAETIAKQRAEQHLASVQPSKDTISLPPENPLTPDEFGELYQFYAEKPHRPVRLDNLMNINNVTDLLNHAKLFHREFAVRVAKRAATLNNAPLGLGRMSAIEELRKMYEWSFADLRSVEAPTNRESALALDRVVRRVYLRHQSGRPLMLDGLRQLTHREGITRRELRNNIDLYKDYKPLQDTFEHFVSARAKLRFLLVNYMELSHRLLDIPSTDPTSQSVPPPNLFGHDESTFAGTICRETSMVKLVECAKQEAEEKFPDIERRDDDFPKVNVRVVGDPNLTFIGFPQNTVQIITAMIEAAIRSNLRRSDEVGVTPTPVNVIIAQRPGASEIGVRVSDTAGGIPFHELPMSLAYLYNCDVDDPHLIELPYVAVLAKTFGGHLHVSSIDGYGTDRVLYTPAGKALLNMAL